MIVKFTILIIFFTSFLFSFDNYINTEKSISKLENLGVDIRKTLREKDKNISKINKRSKQCQKKM